MRGMVAASLAIVLGACSQHQAANQASVAEKVTEPKPATNAANPETANTAATENAAETLPPANSAMRFVGKWAHSKAECALKPWTFTAKALTTKGGPQCSFYHVATAPGGYDVAATCPTKRPVHTDLIKLRFAESAQAMLVESNAIAPTGLVYCGK